MEYALHTTPGIKVHQCCYYVLGSAELPVHIQMAASADAASLQDACTACCDRIISLNRKTCTDERLQGLSLQTLRYMVTKLAGATSSGHKPGHCTTQSMLPQVDDTASQESDSNYEPESSDPDLSDD